MNKIEAIVELMREFGREKTTQTAINRVLRACRVLELNRQDTIRILMEMDFANSDGKPWRGDFDIRLPEE